METLEEKAVLFFIYLLMLAVIIAIVIFYYRQYMLMQLIQRKNRLLPPWTIWLQLLPGLNLLWHGFVCHEPSAGFIVYS